MDITEGMDCHAHAGSRGPSWPFASTNPECCEHCKPQNQKQKPNKKKQKKKNQKTVSNGIAKNQYQSQPQWGGYIQ
jgi:hypothetical protein